MKLLPPLLYDLKQLTSSVATKREGNQWKQVWLGETGLQSCFNVLTKLVLWGVFLKRKAASWHLAPKMKLSHSEGKKDFRRTEILRGAGSSWLCPSCSLAASDIHWCTERLDGRNERGEDRNSIACSRKSLRPWRHTKFYSWYKLLHAYLLTRKALVSSPPVWFLCH